MISLLLDTHAPLWVLVDPERTRAATLATVRAPETTVSAASAWGIAQDPLPVVTTDAALAALPAIRTVR